MPENWMGWAQVIAAVITGTVLVIVGSWQGYTRLVRPLLKHFEPMVQEITGPGNEPGIRKLVEDGTAMARAGLMAANNASENVNLLRREVREEHVALRREVDGVKGDMQTLRAEVREGFQKQGERIGAVERAQAVAHAMTEGGQGPAGAGADRSEILDPQPPPGGTVSAVTTSSKDKRA